MSLREENFIYFFTVSGFFIGLVYALMSTNDAFEMLWYTLQVTLFFYLFVHIVIINFVNTKLKSKDIFNYKQHEEVSEYFIHEIHDREKRMGGLLEHKSDEQIDQETIDAATQKKAA